MDSAYAIPGTVALVEWILAAAVYAVGWHRAKPGLYPLGDGLVLAGLVTALVGIVWLAWDTSSFVGQVRSSLATGLAVSALTVHVILARQHRERLSAFAMLCFVIPIQAYAVGRLWWAVEIVLPDMFLPHWMTLVLLTGLVGYGGLAVGATMIILCAALAWVGDRLTLWQLQAVEELPELEWQSLQIALVALSASLTLGLVRSWWGLGQIVVGSFLGGMITWLLLTAGVYGLLLGAVPGRLARALLVLACAIGVLAVLALGRSPLDAGSLGGTHL